MDPKLTQAVHVAAKAFKGCSPTPELCQVLLHDPATPATVLLCVAQHMLPPTWRAWEPETLWKEFKEPAPVNRDKIGAAIALDVHPMFYWNLRVFGATVQAFNDELVQTISPPELSAPHMAWACYEAELIFALTDPGTTEAVFDDEPKAYIAANLLHAGYVLAPEGLAFVDDELGDMLRPEAQKFQAEVQTAWRAQSNVQFDESALGVQLARQAEVKLYVVKRTDELIASLKRLH